MIFLTLKEAGKVTGSRFTVYKGLGARLERALISYFLRFSCRQKWIYMKYSSIYG